jgi:uncharacterized protein YndB with AHSA1/START domain
MERIPSDPFAPYHVSRARWNMTGDASEGSAAAPAGEAEPNGSIVYRSPKQLSSRGIRKTVVVPASVSEVWIAWTTNEGGKTFFAPECNFELRVGGPYEVYFDPSAPKGSRGGDGYHVLSFVPREMLSFTWGAPPTIPTLRDHFDSYVVVRFQSLDENSTRVTLDALGFGVGKDWDEDYEYFVSAWDVVLYRVMKRFRDGPIDWTNRPVPPEGWSADP